jgi:hypothetical protein
LNRRAWPWAKIADEKKAGPQAGFLKCSLNYLGAAAEAAEAAAEAAAAASEAAEAAAEAAEAAASAAAGAAAGAEASGAGATTGAGAGAGASSFFEQAARATANREAISRDFFMGFP